MPIVLDIIVLALFIFNGVRGYKKGLIHMLLKLLGLIFVIIISFSISGYVATIIYNGETGRKVEKSVHETIYTPTGEMKSRSKDTEKDIYRILNFINKDDKTSLEISKAVSSEIAKRTIHVVVFLVIVVVASIAMLLLRSIVDKIVSMIPIVSGVNRLSGMLVAIITMAIVISSLLYVVRLVEYSQQNLVKNINNSYLTKFIYNHNAIDAIRNMKK